ncbi:N(4)-(Beta-N-acetylglucosaminyl)-L-asparaginase precursor [bacterium BMS3Bbin04]|nr:N(4)-(Beta-N-acetylglucosaminyl)-L-asparaginase precursor [bacterium BMS3Bbin04]
MDEMKQGRREFIGVSAGAAAGIALAGGLPEIARAQSATISRQGRGAIAVASGNGLEAVRRAVDGMRAGEDALDAAIAGVNIVEADPDDITVGYGGLPNENGIVELDSAVMHGPTHRAGAVASIRSIMHPSRVANLVRTTTDHVLLVGQGALEFAKMHGFKEEDLLTEKSRKIWLLWKQKMSDVDDWLPPPKEEVDPDLWNMVERFTGTIHLSARDAQGEVSCVTTTSGLFFKIPGRVGDSPIIGAGLYCDNRVGTAGSTGRGEANLQNLCSYQAVEFMRQGMGPSEAGLEVLKRVAENTNRSDLLDEQGRPNFGLKFYLIDKQGRYGAASMWGPADFAIADDDGVRKEAAAFLYERD